MIDPTYRFSACRSRSPSFIAGDWSADSISEATGNSTPTAFGAAPHSVRAFRFTVLGLSVAFRIDGPKVSAVLTIVSLTICEGIAHRAVFVALSFVRSSRRQEQLTTLLPGLASSGLTSNRHSLLVRVDEVQGYQGGQVVPAQYRSVWCR